MFYKKLPSGRYCIADTDEIVDYALRTTEDSLSGRLLNCPDKTAKYVRLFYRKLDPLREHFVVIYLNARHIIIDTVVENSGTTDGAHVYVKEIARAALSKGATSIIAVHNHPSKVLEPSGPDRQLTRRLVDGLALLDIRVLDHIICSGEDYTSFAQRGLL